VCLTKRLHSEQLYKDIGAKYNIFLSIIPIGAFEPRWFMRDMHMTPEEAVLTHKDLKSKYSIASHFRKRPVIATF